MRRRRNKNFIQSLAGFLFGWLRKSIPDIYFAGFLCDEHGQFDCNICREKWERYEMKNPQKAAILKAQNQQPGRSRKR